VRDPLASVQAEREELAVTSTTSAEVLGTYLNDHLAGANMGVEIAHRLREHPADGVEAAVLARLAEEIEQDREELRRIVERFGETGHLVKKATGWITGKAHRLGATELLAGDKQLGRLLEAETLALGIDGKLALWEALRAVAPEYPQLVESELARLADRAREQRARMEGVRLGAVRRAFGAGTGAGT
jgi:hypothetical protein